MLAFDIETEGLDSRKCAITVACVYDPARNIRKTFNFIADPSKFEERKQEFLRMLDEATSLCAFNGVRFDVPFIAARFGVNPERQGRWVMKLLDLFEVCKLALGSSCSLNNLLLANGHEVKSSNGMQAVIWARQKKWRLLEDYCMKDTVLTYEISQRALQHPVALPLTGWPPSTKISLARDPLDARISLVCSLV
jgi:uncharacterized protein YprB with RNaseH-like and TPR domain